jgi:two-component system, chemotaxis family, CheB/CheR fusion protein
LSDTTHAATPALSWEALGRAVVETVRAPLLVLDDGLRVRLANPAFLEVTGLEEEGVVGRSLFEVGDGAWDQPRLRELLERVLPAHHEIRDLELVVATTPGLLRTFRVNARQLSHEGASRDLVLLALDDVTEAESLRAEVQRHLARLERSNRDLEEFAHAASHDLQEPLRKVRTYAQRIVDRLSGEELGETEHQYLARMMEATERMQQRIDDMLRLGRLSQVPPELGTVELAEVVAAVLSDLESAMDASGAVVQVGALPRVTGDAAQLRLLFQNLVSNAIKFRRPGVAPRIRITESAGDPAGPQESVVIVEDNGIGFEQGYAERIFRPFERLHGRDVYEGTGIGLSICRRVMENHHGRIRSRATPGEGAVFVLHFPPFPDRSAI